MKRVIVRERERMKINRYCEGKYNKEGYYVHSDNLRDEFKKKKKTKKKNRK